MDEWLTGIVKKSKSGLYAVDGGKKYRIPRELPTTIKQGQRVEFRQRDRTVKELRTIGPAPGQTPDISQEQFINPYNFVPFRKRAEDSDHAPNYHDHWKEHTYSGFLSLVITTETPLLMLKQVSEATDDKPAVFTVRTDSRGEPVIPGSSIKGMLRSVIEQATGSPLGIFGHQGARFSYRATSDDARKLKIARVKSHDPAAEILELEVLTAIKGAPVWDTWIPDIECSAVLNKKHRDLITVVVKQDANKQWHGVSLASGGQPLAANEFTLTGYLHKTGRSIDIKKRERIFPTSVRTSGKASASVKKRTLTLKDHTYGTLMSDWRERLMTLSEEQALGPNGEPLEKTPYSPRQGGKRPDSLWWGLEEGATLFVRFVDDNHQNGEVEAMYPGMITRELDPDPIELEEHLKPSESVSRLSPAERMFGWTAPQGDDSGGYRGQLRFGAVQCSSHAAIHRFTNGIQLAPLNSPKPNQARFYTHNKQGKPRDGENRSEGYKKGLYTLAGNKVYPHQNYTGDYWSPSGNTWTADEAVDRKKNAPYQKADNGHFRYYLAPHGTKYKVSFATDSWVKPKTGFGTTIRFDNLSKADLQALLWAADFTGDPADGRFYRLGMGKPLGFGSVSVRIDFDKSAIWTTDNLCKRYLFEEAAPETEDALRGLSEEFDNEFRKEASTTYLAMLNAAKGFDEKYPVHYPWVRPAAGDPIEPQAETYRYFVSNDKGELANGGPGPKHALPTINSEIPLGAQYAAAPLLRTLKERT